MPAPVFRQMLEVMTMRGGPYAGMDIPEFYALVFNSGFGPVVDPGRCAACETCIDRCPPAALKMGDQSIPVVNMDRCFGCAVCASGCPQDAILMQTRPGWQEPPGSIKDLITALKKDAAARQI